MPIDTSSYYPEVPQPDGMEDNLNLNDRDLELFGGKKNSDDGNDKIPEEGKDSNQDSGRNEEETSEAVNMPGGLEKTLTLFSNFLSWALVPLLMPVYGLIMAFQLSMLELIPVGLKLSFIFVIFGINFIVPVLLVLMLKKMGVVDDIGLNGRKERLIPYIITMVCLGCSAWFLGVKGAPIWLCMFFTGGAVAAFINLLVNFKWKISAHAAAIAGIIALLVRMEKETITLPELFPWLLITILCAGLLGSARVWLGRHTVWQVVAGYAVGFCSVFFLSMV